MDNGEINLDPKLVTRLMARAPDYLSARAVFERTAGAPENRETIHFNVLINKATRLVAAEIRKDMISANVAANEYTFHALIPKTAPSHILELLKEMQDAGLKPTARTYELTLEHADACGVESTVEKLLSGGFVFTPEMASVVARRLPAEKAFVVLKRIEDGGRRVRQADFVGLLARHEPSFEFGVAIVGHLTATGRKPNPALCAKLLETTPEAELLDAVAFLERRGLSKDTVIFTVLIDRAGSLPDGLRWYDAMRHAGIAPDERTFSILLAKCSDYTEAEKLMAEMRAQGVVANEFHYAALLRRAPPGEIAGILKRMEECGVRQDVRIYNEVFGKRGRDALSFDAKLRLYLSRPKELIPNAFTFGNLIASCPDLRSAHKLLDDMGELGVARTNFINICLVRLAPNYKDARREAELASAPEGHWTAEVLEALLQQATRFRERFDVGRDVLETMLRFGFSPDVRSLEYLMQNATAEESEWLLSKLPEFGIEPSQILLTLALSAARRNAARDFGAVLRKLTGFGLREDKYTLAIRVQAAEEYAAAVKLFNDTSPSIQPDARVFEALMHKAPDLAERRRWLKAAEHAACPPSAEMYVALLLKSSSGQATELWREMLDIGLRPTARAYSAYMRVLDYDTAYRLYEEMIGADVRPNEEVYRQLVRKAPAEARTELIEDMAAHELKPGIRIYEALVESAPSYAAAQTDFVSMLEAGVQPRPQTIGMVTSLIAKSADMRAFMNTLEDRQVALTPSTIRMLVRAARTYCSPTQAARIERRLWRLKSSERTAA